MASQAILTSEWFGIWSNMYGSRLQSSGPVFWSGSELDRDQEESRKKQKGAGSKPSEVECCCSMHAQYCGCSPCLPSAVFFFFISCLSDWLLSQYWTYSLYWLTDSFDVDYPPEMEAVIQTSGVWLTYFQQRPFMIPILWGWPSKTYCIFHTFKCSKTKKCIWYISRRGFTLPLVKCLCLCAIEHLWQTFFFPSICSSSTAAYIDLDLVHLDIPPPWLHACTVHTYILASCLLPFPPVSSHCLSFLTFLRSGNRGSGNGQVIADSPPASASLGRCLFVSPRIVTLSISPVPPYLT